MTNLTQAYGADRSWTYLIGAEQLQSIEGRYEHMSGNRERREVGEAEVGVRCSEVIDLDGRREYKDGRQK